MFNSVAGYSVPYLITLHAQKQTLQESCCERAQLK